MYHHHHHHHHLIMSTTSSCRKNVNSQVKTLSGAEPYVFLPDKVVSVVAEVGSLFRRMASICESTSVTFGATLGLCGRVRAVTVDAARMFFDSVRRSCYADLQPALAKRIGTAAHRKVWVLLQCSWQAGLQPDVAKCIATACYSCAMQDCSWRLLNGF